jgi:hypothetical protein
MLQSAVRFRAVNHLSAVVAVSSAAGSFGTVNIFVH